MQNQAEVVRLEAQLTVPTRNRTHLSDLWFAVSCGTGFTVWAAEFGRISVCEKALAGAAGTFQVVTMSERQGWVVTRGVDLSVYTCDEIEVMVRAAVTQVNESVYALPTVESIPSSRLPWSRIVAPIRAGEHSVWRRLLSSLPSTAVDARS